jgi:hypothetical protein
MLLCVQRMLSNWAAVPKKNAGKRRRGSLYAIVASRQARLTEFLVRRDEGELLHDDIVCLICKLNARDGVAKVTHLERIFRLPYKVYSTVNLMK